MTTLISNLKLYKSSCLYELLLQLEKNYRCTKHYYITTWTEDNTSLVSGATTWTGCRGGHE